MAKQNLFYQSVMECSLLSNSVKGQLAMSLVCLNIHIGIFRRCAQYNIISPLAFTYEGYSF